MFAHRASLEISQRGLWRGNRVFQSRECEGVNGHSDAGHVGAGVDKRRATQSYVVLTRKIRSDSDLKRNGGDKEGGENNRR